MGKILLLLMLAATTAFAQTNDSTIVVFREGTNMSLTLSPDQSTFVADIQGTLWTISSKGGKAKAITDAMGDCRQPSFSPDGKEVVFQSYRDGGWHLWKVNKDGTGLTQLTFGIYDDREPNFSPDGKNIVFSSDRSGIDYDIYELTLANSEIKKLTSSEKNEYNPVYSPDGKTIAFVSERTGKPTITTISSGKETEIVTPAGTAVAAPSFSSDGSKLLYYVFEGGRSRLMITSLADKKSETITVADEDPFPFRAAWMSSTEFFYTSDGLIKKKTLGSKKVTSVPFEATVALNRTPYVRKKYDFDSTTPIQVKGITSPVVSPDGKTVAFCALTDLWLLTIGQPTPKQLIKDNFVQMEPAFSPDGKKLAFVSDKDGTMDVWLYDLTTDKQSKLTSDEGNESMPAWSPDGRYIAYYQNEVNALSGGSTLIRLEVATGETQQLHAPLFAPSQPAWSADGKVIAVSGLEVFSSRFREGLNKIFFIPTSGASDRKMMPVNGRTLATRGENGPVWSPDGTFLAYVLDGVLWMLPVSPDGNPVGPPHRLTNELADSPSWTGDSKTIVFTATDVLKRVSINDGAVTEIPMTLTWKPQMPTASTKIIHAGRLFDGKSNTYKTNVDITIEGNRIKTITPHTTHSGDVIDASALTVMPGLFEMHAHQSWSTGEVSGRNWLAFGITSVREPGADPYDALQRKETWGSGVIPGPREFFTGNLQDGARVYYGLANSLSEAGMALEFNRADKLGYDLLKTYVRLPDYLQRKVTDFAHSKGIPVSSHEIYPATSYGVDNVEHVGATSRRGYSPLRSQMTRSYQDVTDLIIKSGLRVTPTAALYGGFSYLTFKDSTLLQNKQYVALYSDAFRDNYKNLAKRMASNIESTKVTLAGLQKTIRTIVAGGAHITAGTDSPILPFGLSLHLEIQTYVDGGLTPYQALQSATIWAAESLAVEKDLGSIEPGKLADIIFVEGDPLKNIRDAWNVNTVIRNGVVYKVGELLKRAE